MLVKKLNNQDEWENLTLPVRKVRITINHIEIDVVEYSGEIGILSPNGRLVVLPGTSNQIFIKTE